MPEVCSRPLTRRLSSAAMAQREGLPDRAPSAARDRWSGPLLTGLLLAGVLLAGAATIVAYGGPAWGYDFAAYHDAAQRLAATGSPYQPETLEGPFRPGPGGLYLYSPVLAVVLLPLTGLDHAGATLLWLLARLAVLVLACALMPASIRVRLATLGVALLSLPVIDDLRLGNVSLLVTLLAVVAWRRLDRPLGSLALALSMTLRPTMGLVLAWWLIRGRLMPALWSAAALLAIVLLSLPFVGELGYLDYVSVLRNITDVMGVERNVDLGSSALMLGAPAWLASLALFAGYALAAAATLLSLRRDRELSFVVVVGATLLVAPLLWGHYLTLLLITAAFLASRGRLWGLALPLLGWLPEPLLPGAALAAVLLPFLAPDRGEPAGSPEWVERLRSELSTTRG